MAYQVTIKKTVALAGNFLVIADVTLDTSYPALGYPLQPIDFKASAIHEMGVAGVLGVGTSFAVHLNGVWDRTNKTLRFYYDTTGVEVTTSDDVHAVTATVWAFTKGGNPTA